MKKDKLFELFLKRLHNCKDLEETHSDFIKNITHEFFLTLSDSGHIPADFRQGVLEDIEHEVIEMYRKKTYGSFTLKEYRTNYLKKSA